MANYGMIIDLKNCVGCAGCDIACKTENNLDHDVHWSFHITETTGVFPNVGYRYIPKLCNHCENASCVKVCPTQAMYKDENGLTLHDPDKCIGCRSCELACPYNCISFNEDVQHQHQWQMDTEPLLEGITSSGKEIAEKFDNVPFPNYNPDRAKTYDGVRRKGIVEKCTLCDHRILDGKDPWCVVSCPADARIFGDFDDPKSEVSILLAENSAFQLLKSKGTKPKVYYINEF
ncbi:MAG: 4Fe-4S dicluster domain-containing protein [Candidatus Marinimicrobia bacterium]|nr:4Fe-4S dicluster domain-containing protein [Candidatus Neomarinimicrobiota bacterium]